MMFCSRDIFHKEPFGAVESGTTVTLRLVLPQHLWEPVLEVFFNDSTAPNYSAPLHFLENRGNETVYCTTFTPEYPGVYFYRFLLNHGQHRLGLDDGGCAALDDDDRWQLTVYEPGFKTPERFHGSVFYQIFPDRFYNSGKPKADVPGDRVMHDDWNEDPKSRPDPDGEFRCNDYFGGDLAGIEAKLPYLTSLGVEAIYLNPIFEAHSNHRYNTADYLRVDPLLGTNEDFVRLCKAAHKLGISIILDGVFNHTGSDSRYFNREGRYGEHEGACRDPESRFRDWYQWIDYPTRYHSWWGFLTLPDVREECADYREFICGKDGVLAQWLRLGADGFRLDVADELPDDFIAEIRTAIKREKPDALLLGEVWEDASNKHAYGKLRQYFQGWELDSVMNYPWRSGILNFIRNGDGQMLLGALCMILENYPAQVLAVALNSLSTHDVPRALTAIAAAPMDGHDRDWQRSHNTLEAHTFYSGRQLFLLASLMQYSLPGCPCLYYGDEAALVGYADPFNRGTYPWGHEDTGMVEFFRLLGQLRKATPALRIGEFVPIHFDYNAVTYLRLLGEDRLLICINRGREGVNIPWDGYQLEQAETLLTVGGIQGCDWLEGNSGVILRLPAAST